jgi:uncharacterized membrane protein YcaP (DUF421 family)
MELEVIWKAVMVILAGTFLLRVAGRKSISQMTLAQTVLMIGLGSLLVQPIAQKGFWTTVAVGGVLILTLMVLEYGQLKFDVLEKLITGKSLVLVENGQLKEKNLKKLRLTVDQLEMQLRQSGVSKISDVKWATLEPNGRMGYLLNEQAQYATKEDIQKIMDLINTKMPYVKLVTQQADESAAMKSGASTTSSQDIFSEIANGKHADPPPTKLQ